MTKGVNINSQALGGMKANDACVTVFRRLFEKLTPSVVIFAFADVAAQNAGNKGGRSLELKGRYCVGSAKETDGIGRDDALGIVQNEAARRRGVVDEVATDGAVFGVVVVATGGLVLVVVVVVVVVGCHGCWSLCARC